MIWRDVTLQQFQEETERKEIICVGYGQLFHDMTALWDKKELKKIVLIADNNKHGEKYELYDNTFTLIPVEKLSEYDLENACILITSLYCKSLYSQLERLLGDKKISCYIYPVMSLKVEKYDLILRNGINKIPKKIHYFWFGKGEIPEENRKCIESWKKYCPQYEIIKWTEENYDVTKCNYMRQAYENRKWGFVPDYARLDILYQYGGIYLDTDVELISGLDDLLFENAFIGFQRNFWINIGLGCGCEKGMNLFGEMRDAYENINFVEDGRLNLLASPYYQTLVLKRHGLKCNNQFQKINGISVFPTDVFDPQGYSFGKVSLTKNTHSIHHYSESWLDDEQRDKNLARYKEVNHFR
ncbi:MAG: hypothetical protein HFH15_10365 [Ruminococcus sp.]|nr:hypothetical protein [Ruminococcus sp.]